MRYQIINPSDRYTIDCADHELAAVACVLLGQGQYAFEALDDSADDVDVPILLFGGADDWFQQHFHGTAKDVVTRVQVDRAADLATALDSVFLGDARERDLFTLLSMYLTADERHACRATWHDQQRTSTNDIGARAWAMARKLRGEGVPVDPAPQQVFLT